MVDPETLILLEEENLRTWALPQGVSVQDRDQENLQSQNVFTRNIGNKADGVI